MLARLLGSLQILVLTQSILRCICCIPFGSGAEIWLQFLCGRNVQALGCSCT